VKENSPAAQGESESASHKPKSNQLQAANCRLEAGGWPLLLYRLLWPRTSFRTFFFCEPRGVVRFALGAAFLRVARFTFLRSALSAIDFVFAIRILSRSRFDGP